MSWEQFRAWRAYYDAEPFGEERADLRSAIVAMTVANVNIDTRKTKPFEPKDFMPFAQRRRPSMKPIDQDGWERMKLLAAAYAGMDDE